MCSSFSSDAQVKVPKIIKILDKSSIRVKVVVLYSAMRLFRGRAFGTQLVVLFAHYPTLLVAPSSI